MKIKRVVARLKETAANLQKGQEVLLYLGLTDKTFRDSSTPTNMEVEVDVGIKHKIAQKLGDPVKDKKAGENYYTFTLDKKLQDLGCKALFIETFKASAFLCIEF